MTKKNIIRRLNIRSNNKEAKKFDILAISLSVLQI